MVDLHGILLARKDLWEIVVGGKTTLPKNAEAWQKWKIQVSNNGRSVETYHNFVSYQYIQIGGTSIQKCMPV